LTRPAPRWRWGEPVAPLALRLARGGVLAIPTESSYGLGADPRSAVGVAAVFRIKGRPQDKPLPVVAADVEQLAALGIDPGLPILAALRRCWPGPLTAVLPASRPLPASAGTATLAVRVPGHVQLRRLLAELGTPLTATSANRAGEPPALAPASAAALLAGEDAVVVDDGPLTGGAPSTLVAFPGGGTAGFRVLRQGAFAVAELEAAFAAEAGSPAGA
jgi:L-threonylcarbamoyladenylate synthase